MSTRSIGGTILLASIALAVLWISLSQDGLFDDDNSGSRGLEKVERVADGDTLVLESGERIRLYAIDAPEIGEPGADAATDRLRELAGDRVILVKKGTDQFDRTLACVYAVDGTSIDNLLITEGLARPWEGASCDPTP